MKKSKSSRTSINFESISKDAQIFKDLFESAPDIIWIHDDEGNILSCNDKAIQMTGYSRKELESMNLRDIVASTIDFDDKIKSLVENTEGTFKSIHRRKDGNEYPVEVHARLISLNNQSIIISFARDITKRKQIEEALLESEEIFRRFMEYSPIHVFFKDENIRALRLSKNYEKMLGKPVEELLGKNMYDLFPSELAKNMVADDMRILKEGKDVTVEEEFNGRFYSTIKFPIFIDGKPRYLAGYTTDITDRKKAEESLKENEQRFREMAELLPNTIFEADLNGMITYVNQTGFNKFGYSQKDIADGLNMFKLLVPEDRGKAKEQIGRRLKGEKSAGNEYTALADNGNTFPAIITTNLMLKDGNPIGVRGVVTDITEHKIAEQELRESEEKFRIITENSADAIFIANKQGKCLYVNKKACDLLGYSYEDMTKMFVIDRWFSENKDDDYLESSKELMNTGKISREIELQKKDGSVIAADLNAVILPNGLVYGSCRDITERRRAEEALLKSEALMVTAIKMTNLCLYEEEGEEKAKRRMTFHDERMRMLLGMPQNEEHRARDYWIEHIHPEDMQNIMVQAIRKFEDQGENLVSAEYRYLNDKRGWIWFSHVAYALSRNEKGEALRLVGAVQDITERKRAEEEKEKLETQLQQAQKIESVGQLAGGIAHDFNNLLGVIIGYAEMALMQANPAQQIHAYLTEIRNAGERSADLTRKLLTFARKQTVAPKTLDLNETVEGMLKMLRRLIGEDVNLTWLPGLGLWQVKVDPSQIDQILANLCVNARDAITDIGKITIETENSVMDKEYCARHAGFIPGEYVRLAVSDNGCGMDKETLVHIFEPFFTTKGVGKGTGLGLASVYGAVKQNNGFINVDSEPGSGTTFTIYLPRHAGEGEPDLTEGAMKPVQCGSETILLVEDDPEILNLAAMVLKGQGYTVLAAPTPGEAISAAREYPGEIHLLMTDVVMPEMNGRDLAKNLLSFYPRLKLLFMSGYTANVIAHHGVLDEGVYFVQKPFSIKSLAAKVREVLDIKEGKVS